jgi:hypothetical protein
MSASSIINRKEGLIIDYDTLLILHPIGLDMPHTVQMLINCQNEFLKHLYLTNEKNAAPPRFYVPSKST